MDDLIKRANGLSDGAKTAIVLTAPAFRFGGNWAFILKTKNDYRGYLEALSKEKPNIKAIQVSNGALILSDENFLAYNINAVAPGTINGSFVDMANKRRNEEKEKFQKFIDSVSKGKSNYVKKENGYYELVIGTYSLNDTNLIRLNGIEYPAFKLSLVEVLSHADKLSKSGLSIYARAVTEEGKEIWDKVFNLGSNSKGVAALYRGLEIADSETGVFLTLRLA
jgi:hypothetical protein